MNFNINTLRDKVRNANVNVDLTSLRSNLSSNLSSGLNSIRENVTTAANNPRLDVIRNKLGYAPAPTEEISPSASTSTASVRPAQSESLAESGGMLSDVRDEVGGS